MATNAAMTVITTTVRTIGRLGSSPDTELSVPATPAVLTRGFGAARACGAAP